LTVTILKNPSTDVRIALMPIDELKPHEKGSPLYLEFLKKEILKDGVLKYPVIADEETRVILDGMHRWLALKSLGYKYIPTLLVQAFQRSTIRVGTRRIHRYQVDLNEKVTIDKVIASGLSGKLLPPRTTRHFFPFSKLQLVNYPLRQLMKGAPTDVSRYLANMTEEESKAAIGQWLSELSEELNFLDKRKAEVAKERSEFLTRLNGYGIFP
jgi:hypothetical protein